MKWFKSPWFYWHTGYPFIAITSVCLSALLMVAVFVAAAGFSVWGVIVAVLLDAVGLLLVALYLLFFRTHIPDFIGLQAGVDRFVVQQLLAPMLVGFFVTRAVTFFVAKARGYPFSISTPTHEPPA